MSDRQLIKDVAAIADLGYKDGKVLYSGDWINPLLDSMRAKALCFELMVYYKVEIEYYSNLNFGCACDNSWVSDKNPNRAIFLAIRVNKQDEVIKSYRKLTRNLKQSLKEVREDYKKFREKVNQ